MKRARKFENVDIIDTLNKVMQINTKHYQSDFEYDKDMITKAAGSVRAEDRYLLFMARPAGTYCFREKDVFMKETTPHNTWKFYGEQTNDKILAYAVKITGTEDGVIKGDLYELDYAEHFKHINHTAVKADNELISYKFGDVKQPARADFPITHPYYGDFIKVETIPNNPDKLDFILRQEHKSYEQLARGDIDTHLENVYLTSLREQIKKMSPAERREHIDMVELARDYGDRNHISQRNSDIYNMLTSRNMKEKPSIRRQLADNKTKSVQKPKLPKTPKKEDIAI